MPSFPVPRAAFRPAAWWGVTATLAVGWAILALWTPPGERETSICMLRRVLVPCPGCGMTRAVALLAKGRWTEAVALHPLAPVLTAQGLALWAAWGVALLRDRLPRAVSGWLGWGLVALNVGLLLGVWVLRLAHGSLPG